MPVHPKSSCRRLAGLALLLLGPWTPGCSKPAEPNWPRPIVFAALADVQYADAPHSGTRRYREALGKLDEAVEGINRAGPLFTLNLGDLIDKAGSDPAAALAEVMESFGRLEGPLHHAVGNHCLDAGREELGKYLTRDPHYYHFEQDGWRFVILDGNDICTRGYPEEDPRRQKAMEYLKSDSGNRHWNGALGEEQLAWFQHTVERACRAGERVIVASHFPLLKVDHPLQMTLWNADQILAVLDSNPCVVALFAGHHHDGAYELRNGIHHLVLPALCDAPADANAFALVHLSAGRLRLEGFGTVPSRDLELPDRSLEPGDPH